jgi:zinc protease
MHRRFLIPCAAVLALLVTGASPPPSSAGLSVTRTRLDNGLQVVIVVDRLAPVVTTELNYRVGSDEAPPGFPGMAHAQEHMMFRGSQGLTTGQLADINAAMGGDYDADTQNTVTQYFSTVPAADLDVVLHVEAIRMRGVLDSEAEWEQERGAIEQEVARDLSSPFYRFYSAALAKLFAGTPYEHDALGTRASFERTTGAMLKRFYDAWYHPNNAILVIAGDVDPQAALASVRRYFGPIPAAPLPARRPVRLGLLSGARIELPSDYPVPIVLLAYRFPGYRDPDYAAADVLGEALASQRGALYDLGVTGKALGAGFFMGSTLPEAGAALAYAAVPPGADTERILTVLEDVIDGYARDGVPQDLVDAAKKRLLTRAAFAQNSIAGLADAWSDALALQGLSSPAQALAAISRVTKADVDRVARTSLVNGTAVIGILTPHPSGAPVASRGFGGAESFSPTQTQNVTLPAWAQAPLSSLEVPASHVSPTQTILPNGIRLIVQPETITPTVTVLGEVKSNPDLETPPGKEGVATVLDDLFAYGTQSLDRVAFVRALDELGADEHAGSSFSLSVLAADFDRGVALLADNELHPALPAQNFAIVRSQVALTVRGEQQSPDYLTTRALNQALYPKGDPTQREATPETVGALSLDDVKNYYATAFRPDLTTIVVIGDITPDEARTTILKWFGAWTATGPPPDTELRPVPPNPPASVTVPNAARVQDDVTLAETLGITRGDPDYYALQVGDHVLGGGFYATRLYRDVRQQAGLAYSIGNSLNIGKTRSLYTVSFGCDPPNVSKVRAIVVRDLKAMQTSPVTPSELALAKALLLHEIPLREASEESIAEGLLERGVAGVPLDEPIRAAHTYIGMTAQKVQAAFAKWIRPDGFVQVVQGPPPS